MPSPRSSIHRKFSYVVLATTALALLITGVAMAIYDLRTFKETLVADLTAQAEILGLAAAPALEFEDPESAQDYLALLRAKPDVVGAAIYARERQSVRVLLSRCKCALPRPTGPRRL